MKVATQMHTYHPNPQYAARNAVDGNTKTCSNAQQIGLGSPWKDVWWKVDLGGVYSIYNITLQFKTHGDDMVERSQVAGFSLYVSETNVSSTKEIKCSNLCYKDGPQLPPLIMTKTCMVHGRYVIVYNDRFGNVIYPAGYKNDTVYLRVCEVTVRGCEKRGMYGSNCEIPCPSNCRGSSCHIQNGTCIQCKPGWLGMYCDIACNRNYYGENCSLSCPLNCKICRHTDGCSTCKAGWMGSNCTSACLNSYGENCRYSCGLHCTNQTCDRFNGSCLIGCADGFYGKSCDRERLLINQDMSSSSLMVSGLSISIVINVIFFVCGSIMCRGVITKRVTFSGSLVACWKKPVYEDTYVKNDEGSTYQELDLPEIAYQNTTA